MTQELLYTSAAQGLNPGSRGFCTVVRTRTMPAPLAPLLESLSGYRPAFAINDPRAAENPVSYSHVRVSAGKTYSVLSRVADYGLDYSQRTNKIAHHVALSSDERPEAGPAWLLAQPGFMDSRWDGQSRTLAAGRRVPTGAERAAACPTWAAITGDAGWAGVLAESWLTGTASYVIFAPGTDTLALIREAVALLPPHKRWDATFSTYYTGLPASASCGCRCVLADSPEAIQARRLPNVLRIDLTQKLPTARGGELVTAARSGPKRATARAESSKRPTPQATENASLPTAIPLEGYALRLRESASLPNTPAGPPPLEPRIRKLEEEKRVPLWVWLIASLSAAAVVFGAIFIFAINRARITSNEVAGDAVGGEAKKALPPPENAVAADNKNKTAEHTRDVAGEPGKAKAASGKEHSKAPDKAQPKPKSSPAPTTATAKPNEAQPAAKQPGGDKKAEASRSAGKPPITSVSGRSAPSPAPKPNSPSLLRLPDFRPGNTSTCDIDIDLPSNQSYSVECIMPVEHKVWHPAEQGALILKAVEEGGRFSIEQSIGMTTRKRIFQLALSADKKRLTFDLTHLQKGDLRPTSEELRDLLHFTHITIRANAFGATPIECHFFDPLGSAVAPQPITPLKAATKSPVGKLAGDLAVPQAKWQIHLPLPISSVSPPLYVERITLRAAGVDYAFVSTKGSIIRYPKGTLHLRCEKLSHTLAALAVEDAMLNADKVDKSLASRDEILLLQFDRTNQIESNILEASIDPTHLEHTLTTVFTEHRNRLGRLLTAAFQRRNPAELDRSPLPEQIQRAERQLDQLPEDAAKTLDIGLKKLTKQRSEIRDCLAPLGKATIVQARIYFKVKDFSHPDDAAGEMDLLRIDPPSTEVQHSDRQK